LLDQELRQRGAAVEHGGVSDAMLSEAFLFLARHSGESRNPVPTSLIEQMPKSKDAGFRLSPE
jgi:hypothetical protein